MIEQDQERMQRSSSDSLPAPNALFQSPLQRREVYETSKSFLEKPNSMIQIELLDREIQKLDGQIDHIRSEAQIMGGKKVMVAAHRSRIATLQKQRLNYISDKARHSLCELMVKLADSISALCDDLRWSTETLPTSQEIHLRLHAEEGFKKNWEELAVLSKKGNLALKHEIENAREFLFRLEQKKVAELQQQHAFFMKKQQMPRTPGSATMEDEEDETVTEMENLQRNIDRLQQYVPDHTSHAGTENSIESATALKAALFLRKKMKKLSQEVEMKSSHAHFKNVGTESTEKEVLPKVRDAMTKGWVEFDADDGQGRDEYVGELYDDKEHGIGSMSWSDKTKFKGQFCNGYIEGLGHEIYADSSSYKGQFHRNLRHGLGIFVSSLGEQYGGTWVRGERHGPGIVSKHSQGMLKSVFASFKNGHFVEILEDGVLERDVMKQTQIIVRQAMETAQEAKTLESEIRNQAMHEDKESFSVPAKSIGFFGPVYHGPGVQTSPRHEDNIQVKKPHQELIPWLSTMGLEPFADAMRSHGFCKPSHLLPLLMDVNAYDSFVDSICLNAKQQRIFWKSLEHLDVLITPRDVGLKEIRANEEKTGPKVANGTATESLAEYEQEQAARLLLLSTATLNEERQRKVWENSSLRLANITKAVEKEEKRLRRERQRQLRAAISRLNNNIVFRSFFRWHQTAMELGDVRFAEEERLRIEAQAEAARVLAIQLEEERKEADRKKSFEDQELMRKVKESAVKRAEEARQQAIDLQQEKFARQEEARLLNMARAETARMSAISRGREACAIKLQALVRCFHLRRLHLSRCLNCRVLQSLLRWNIRIAVPDALTEARREEFESRSQNEDLEDFVRFQTVVTADIGMPLVEIREPGDSNSMLLECIIAELAIIHRIQVLRNECKVATSVAHRLKMVQAKRRRKLEEDVKRSHKEEADRKERLRREEEERERERRWHVEERKAIRKAAKKDQEVQKAAEVAAQWELWKAEEDLQRGESLTKKKLQEAEKIRVLEHERYIEQARILEQQRRDLRDLLSVGGSPSRQSLSTRAILRRGAKSSPLRVRFSQECLQEEREVAKRRPPAGLIPWDTRFHVPQVLKQRQLPRSRSEIAGRYTLHERLRGNGHSRAAVGGHPEHSIPVASSNQNPVLHQPAANSKARTILRGAGIILQPGALSVSAWKCKHPNAVVRPPTAVRRLLLIQDELRLREKKWNEKLKQRAKKESDRRKAQMEQQREAAAKAEETAAFIAATIAEFELTMATLVDFQHNQEDAELVKRKIVCAKPGVWLPALRQKPSLVDNILARVPVCAQD